MGLDMYFEARKSFFKSFGKFEEEQGKEDETNYPADLKVLGDYHGESHFKSTTVEEYYQIGYFRKFNALHGWIVDHLADGIDECQRIFITKIELEGLLNKLKEVQADHDKAELLLPVSDGCFFGSQDYDEWYFQDVDKAVEMFSLFLENLDFSCYDLVYQASW